MRTTRTMSWAGLLLCGLAVAGCKTTSDTRRASLRSSAPTTPRTLPAEDVSAAVEALCKVLAQRTAEGWPEHILTRDGLPVIRVLPVDDETGGLVRANGVRDQLIDRLVNQRLGHVLGTDGDLDAVWLERDYAKAGVTDGPIPAGKEDRTALVVRGKLVSEQVGRDQLQLSLHLRAVDTVKNQVHASARRSMTVDVPADRLGMIQVTFDTGQCFSTGWGNPRDVRSGSDSLSNAVEIDSRFTSHEASACGVEIRNKTMSVLRLEYRWEHLDGAGKPFLSMEWKALDVDPDDAVWVTGEMKGGKSVNSNLYNDSELRFKLRFRHGLE